MTTNDQTIAGDDLDNAVPFRELDDHKVNPANDLIKIEVIDEPGSGGAHHAYQVTGYDCMGLDGTLITFQNGPINEAGVNGLTHEVLLAIVADRLRCFQKGPYAARFNVSSWSL